MTGPGCAHCEPDPALALLVDPRPVPAGPRERVPTPGVAARDRHADLLVLGTVLTMDPARPVAGSLAVRAGRVLAVGGQDEIDGLRGPDTEVVRLGSAVVLPGFVDPHLHLWAAALVERYVDCSGFASPTLAKVVDRLHAAVAHAPAGDWVGGRFFDPAGYPEDRPLDAAVLDAIAPANPLVVLDAALRRLYANTLALGAAGVHAATPDPPGGGYGRAGGRLTGVVTGMAAMRPVLAAMPRLAHDRLLDDLTAICARAARAGVTSVREAATGALFGIAEMDLLYALAGAGRLATRIGTALCDRARAEVTAAGLCPGAGDDRVRADAWALSVDGELVDRTAALREPYQGSTDRGAPRCDRDHVADVARHAHRDGWQLMVHAAGDAAAEEALAGYERVLADVPAHDLRHRLEHAGLPDDGHLSRMAGLGVTPAFRMGEVYYAGATLAREVLGRRRAGRLAPLASAHRYGLRAGLYSDHPAEPVAPLRAVQAAVTREMRGTGEALNAAERVSPSAALRAVTTDAAWLCHLDDVAGTLAPGRYADLTVLAADPRAVDVEEIADIPVLQTRLAGEVTWSVG